MVAEVRQGWCKWRASGVHRALSNGIGVLCSHGSPLPTPLAEVADLSFTAQKPPLPPHPSLPQTAATVADLFFTAQAFDVAEEAVRLAVTAAEQAQQYGLMIKLSNNLAAVHRNKGE